MKHVIFAVFTAALSCASCAQNMTQSEVPAIVVTSFQQQFPKVSDIEWEKKGLLYEVEFETGLVGKDHKVLIDAAGKVMEHKQDITEVDLPDAVKQSIKHQFPNYRLEDIESIEREGLTNYKLELKNKSEEWKVVFDKTGAILEKIAD